MEWLNSDAPGDESPRCSCCGKQIGIGVDAVAVRVGTVKSTGRFYDFVDKQYDDRLDVRWFHFSCMEVLFNFSDAEEQIDMTDCAFCPEDLLGEPECYEFELGHFEIKGPDTWWKEDRSIEGDFIRLTLCKECMEFGIGEGNCALARKRMGKRPLPEDKKEWINYDEVPVSMLEEKKRPAHLQRRGRRPPSVRR